MKIRFQADVDLNQIIVSALLRHEPTIDFQLATTAKLHNLHDKDVLKYAAQHNRILVTHDQRTMPKHFSDFIPNANSSGVIIIPQKLSIQSVVEDLLILWLETEPKDWINRICYLPF